MLEPESIQAAEKQIQLSTSNVIQQLQCITIHQLDSTYYGEINKSYQKQGLGILQSTEFQTYFGFWKSGKADGKGLIIYPSGCLVYGHFWRNEPSGPVLSDDGETLKVYIFETNGKINVGYEYVYADSEWRLLKNVNTPKQTLIHTQKQSINIKLPDIIAAQHSVYELITSYIAGDFFKPEALKVTLKKGKGDAKKQEKVVDKYQDVKSWLIHTQNQLWLIGLCQQGNFNGIGCKYNRNKMELLETGYYRDGLLEGFAFKREGGQQIIGQYHEGMKHGLFYETTSVNYNIVEYHEDIKFCDHHVKEQTFKKRQKAFHFEQKDFLSAKNLLNFEKIKDTFFPNNLAHYKKKVDSPIQTTLKQNTLNQESSLKKKQPTSPLKKSLTKALPKPSKKPVSILQKHKISHTNLMNNKIESEKTSVEMIRQKFLNMNLTKYEREAREIGEKRHRGLVNNSFRLFGQEQEEAIAEEQNPFDSALHGKNILNQSPARKMP